MIEKTYNVGIYCRLSNDDERDGESVSIENQVSICQGYFYHLVQVSKTLNIGCIFFV